MSRDFALNSSEATTRGVFADPTTHGTIAEYGAPMTSTELAFASDESPTLTYDGAPNADVLASTYQVSTNNGDDAPDSTGNVGCDPSTETGCPDSSVTGTDTNATPSDPVITPRSGLYSPFGDSDCTNFVSQVWHLGGGLPMKLGWRIRFRRRGGLGALSYSRSWTLVRDFVDYMVNDRQTSRLITADVSSSNLPSTTAIADAVEYDWGEGHGWSHLSVVVKAHTSSDTISQHSTNRRQSSWNLGWLNQRNLSIRARMRARVVHLRAP